MKTIQTLRASRLRMLLVLLMTSMMSIPLYATTFKINATTNGYYCYKINDGVETAITSGETTLTVNSGDKVTLHAVPAQGCSFTRWRKVENGNSANFTGYVKTFTVGANNIDVTATFTECSEGDVWQGALGRGDATLTYTLTTSGNNFKVTCSNTSSPYHNKTYSEIGDLIAADGDKNVNIVFNTTKPVMMSGTIFLYRGNLTMKLGNNYTAATTLKRKEGNAAILLHVYATDAQFAKRTLTVNGNTSRNFVFHGGCDGMAIDSTDMSDIHFTKTDSDLTTNYQIIKLEGGTINMDYVTVTNAWNHNAEIAGVFFGDHNRICKVQGDMNHCLLQWCRGVYYGAALKLDNYASGSKVKLRNSTVRYCETYNGELDYSAGGAIRSSGNNLCQLEMEDCEIHHNYTNDRGAGLRWNASLVYPSLTMKRCNFYRNWAKNTGGAMRVEGLADIEGCTFRNNKAGVSGGGISFESFTGGTQIHLDVGGGEWLPKNAKLSLDANTVIEDNEAGQYGGGIYMGAKFVVTYGDEGDFYTFLNDSLTPYKLIFEMNGTTIQNNSAGVDGGAVYMSRGTDYYQLIANLNYGTIDNNSTSENGGSFCITENLVEEYSYPNMGTTWIRPLTGVTYNLSKQSIGADLGEEDITTPLTMTNNSAANGGGIYVNGGSVTIYDNAVVGTENNANICTGGNGGAVHVTGGNLTMKGGSFAYNRAQVSGGQGGHGGGFYVTGGLISVEGGSIDHNTADVDGGGFYVSVPNTTDITTIKGGTQIQYNKAQNGGGAYVNQGAITIQDATTTVANDTASIAGGGIYLGTGNVTITDATLNGNVSQSSDGGGFYVANGSFTANNAAITSNHAPNGNGGGVYAGGTNGHVMLNAGTTVISNNAINGGGICVDGGNLTFTNALMTDNVATNNGGGFYTTGGEVEISGTSAEILSNSATNMGGGMYIGGDIDLQGGTISQNTAGTRGGGVYVAEDGKFKMTGGTIGGTWAQGNYTINNMSYGGGLYMGGGTATLTSGTISGNRTANDGDEGHGGGIYMFGGDCMLSGGCTIGGESADYANKARLGGGIHSAGGNITVKGGHISFNEAVSGGGIYSYGENPMVYVIKDTGSKTDELSYIENNTAEYGGGIYARRGEVHFSDGYIQNNLATKYGGGMYVDTTGMLFLTGNAILSLNHVPASSDESTDGGGVYLLGTVKVGEVGATGSIKADDNYKGASYTYPTINNRNNIFLKMPVASPYTSDQHRGVVWVVQGGITETSHVGFSVPHNHVPVIYCDRSANPTASDGSWTYLDRFKTGLGHDLNTRLFDDTELYRVVHITNNETYFDPDHVYLYGFWPEAVNELSDVPNNGFTVSDDTVTITNKEGFAWLISYVNGLNGSEPHNSNNLVVNLKADIDMKDFGWVPVGFKGETGSTPAPFRGTFNGNGHTIEGVNVLVYGEGTEGFLDYGLFGHVDGGTVQDVFLKGASYSLDEYASLVLGAIAGEADGGTVISNCEAQSTMVTQNNHATMGGLVGRQDGGTVHSCIGIVDMKGGTMGGLVGDLVSGNLYNSFANAKFTKLYNDSLQYMGGLVAVNRGTVENCYARLRGDVPSGNFGILVGDNTDGEVNYCYAPAGMRNYKAAGNAPTGHGNYGDSFLPYLYRHRDTQVSLADDNDFVPSGEDVDKQMLIALNNWVNEMSTDDMAYTKWGRPWQESETNKPLNDDYPILKMPLNDAVAAKTGDPYLYYSPIDTLLVKYTAADEAIWMYRNNSNVTGDNMDEDLVKSKLYIAEDVALINRNPLKAYVGITLDNSAGANGAHPQGGVASSDGSMTDATDWHIIATPLRDAPLGIDYNGDEASHGFSYDHGDMPYYRFYPKDDSLHGYFPSHRFGENYPESDLVLNSDNAGNYYQEWDFYAYDEPQYHWINFKRNSASHWHMDDPAHTSPITYNNEENLVPGKGYFAAAREETFLQCHGTLNYTNDVYYNLTQTPGVPRHGYNLIGNPYQSYLDFNAFVTANVGDEEAIWSDALTASYTILDEDSRDYVTFSYDASNNPATAGRFIHPHQGFFVLLRERTSAKALFTAEMRNACDTVVSKFRNDGHVDYPLVNLYVKESNGQGDRVTVELGRPDCGGATLMKGLRTGNGKIWCRYNDEDYAIAYTQPGVSEVSIRFESVEDTEYTLRWDTYNGEFSYLHLIDNITGANVDCLSEREYKFSSRTTDYTSRFKLVFGYTGIEEDTESEAAPTFAFMMGDEMVVNGEGVLQVFDMNGRLVTSRELHGVQSTVALPEVANGVYVLRLTEGKQSRVQKMVISK